MTGGRRMVKLRKERDEAMELAGRAQRALVENNRFVEKVKRGEVVFDVERGS